MTGPAQKLALPLFFRSRARKQYGPSFMGGTLSAAETRLALRFFLQPGAGGDGRAVAAFEREFARAIMAPHAVAFGKGRVALWAILRGLGIGVGDEVALPGYTCVAVPNAVRFVGAWPLYAEIDSRHFNVTAATCERALTPRTRALIVAHTYGVPAPMAELQALAAARGLFLIEDAAHALGSEHHGRPVGSFGHAAFFSTEHSKCITTGLGGVATTADPELAARLRQIQAECPPPDAARVRRVLIFYLAMGLWYRTRQRRLGDLFLYRSRLYRRAEPGTAEVEHRGAQPPDYLWRMGDAQARLGLEQLRRLTRLNEARRAIVQRYVEAFHDTGLELPQDAAPGAQGDRLVYVRLPYLARRREALQAAATAAGLDLGAWFESPVHPAQTDLQAVGYTPGSCPVAEETCRRIVNLPCHPGVTPADVARYVDLLRRVEG
jgi:perosamine synthetase